jgi:transposase InsO family protein
VLIEAGLLRRWSRAPSKKGHGFQQPLSPHEHWHIDISHLRIAGTFFFLCTVLDGASRFIVHWELRVQMTVVEVELTIQRAKEKFPAARARIISDNGPQFIAKDFKEFIREVSSCAYRRGTNSHRALAIATTVISFGRISVEPPDARPVTTTMPGSR